MKDFKPLIKHINDSVESFQKTVPGVQRDMLNKIIADLNKLELKGGNIAVSVKNVRLITAIKADLMNIILSPEYKDAVKEFAKAFAQVNSLQNDYFVEIENEFKPPALGKEMLKQSVQASVDNLTERGIDANVVAGVEEILRKAITTGGSIAELHEQLANNITNNGAGEGTLQRYTKQITTDALNQHSAQYTQIVASGLGLQWYRYTGSLIETSREFCIACRAKEWIHESEFPKVIAGDFPEFEKAGGKIYKKTGLPEGMIPDTTPSNFQINRGGYGCFHQLRPVRESSVPQAVRDALPI